MKIHNNRSLLRHFLAATMLIGAGHCFGDDLDGGLFNQWLGISANLDGLYQKTQFDPTNHNAGVGKWDSRIEIWLPPHQGEFSYGPYLRFAGIAATDDPAYENGVLAAPGYGFQVYPFSVACLRETNSLIGQVFGPVRLFGEYNQTDYWGDQNKWRPKHQVRAGMEYWHESNVNLTASPWWWEFWDGTWWQSANEFEQHYDSWVVAQAFRAGIRKPGSDILACFTPYIALESSLTKHPTYYWENRLDGGGGLRFAPDLSKPLEVVRLLKVVRIVLYVEYVHIATYYRQPAPASIPDYDLRAGINVSIGDWYH
jgi:hypothetical protein